MGLLDMFNTYEGQQGLGLLAAAGSRSDGAGFGQRLQEGLGYADKWKRNQSAAELEKLQLEAEKQKIEDYKRKVAQDQTMRDLAKRFAVPGQQALSPLAANPELGILASQGKPAVAPSFDYKGYAGALASVDPMEALKLQQSLAKENQFNKMDVKDFTPASVAKFAQTQNYGDLVRLDKAHFANTGGQTVAVDPFTGKPLNSIDNTQSPDSKASNGVQWANYGLAKQRLAFDQNGGTDGGVSQAGFNKQFGKAPAGFRWKSDGSMESIPGGPADQKAQLQQGGKDTVAGVVADLRDKYTQLNSNGGIVNQDNGPFANMSASFGSSSLGQTLGGAVGTKNQTARDAVAMTRPLLLQAIMKATGMSAKQMDSNAELKLYLATASDPTKGYQANMEALDRIEKLYGGGPQVKTDQPAPTMRFNPATGKLEKV